MTPDTAIREAAFCVGLAGGLRAQKLITEAEYIEEVDRLERIKVGTMRLASWPAHDAAHADGWAQAYRSPIQETITGAWKTCPNCNGLGYELDSDQNAVPCGLCGGQP